MERFLSALGSAGPTKLLAALGVTGLVAAALFAIMFKLGTEDNALLYSDLNPKDAAAITESLDKSKIKYKVSSDGTTVYVPASKVAKARMSLASQGLPNQASIGYELFDKQDAMGTTSFVQNINKVRALEGELARTIDSLDTVKDTRVHLVIPEKELFETQQDSPTASIVVGLEKGQLGEAQVNAIKNLVASAVKGLSPDKVTILDERGNLLASAQNSDQAAAAQLDDRKAQYEERMRKRVQELLDGLVGPGASRVQVTADMDFSQVNQTEETFDPDKVAPRSTRTIEETGAENNKDGSVTQGQNVPDNSTSSSGNNSSSNSNRTDETVNYEISKVTKTSVIAPGTVKRLSIAVAVDGITTPATKPGGPVAWKPRSQDEMTRITNLVRSAAGIDDQRGDKIQVDNVQFAKAAQDAGSKAPGKFDFDKSDIMYAIQLLALTLIAVALIFFVARPLVKGIFDTQGGAAMRNAIAGGGAPTGLPEGAEALTGLPSSEGGPDAEATVDIARIQGSVNAQAMQQVSDVVTENPEQTISVIRSWLQERK